MLRYRLSEAAQGDVLSILAWTHEQFGEAARLRYQSLIIAALRDVAGQPDRPGSLSRPELGAGVRSWHLRLSGHTSSYAMPEKMAMGDGRASSEEFVETGRKAARRYVARPGGGPR